MKHILRSSVLFLLLAASACKKSAVISSDTVSNLDVANMVAYELAVNANGFSNLKADIVLNAQNMVAANTACGTVTTSMLARQEPAASLINYNYALGYTYTYNCVDNTPDNIDSKITFDGSFDGASASSVNSGTSAINVSGLAASTLSYTLNGTYNSTGTFKMNTGDKFTGNEVVAMNFTNVAVKKSSRGFTGGSGTVNVSGSVDNKGAFNYNGSIVFDGNGTATLTLEAHTYIIDLTTGDVTAQ